LDGVLRPAHEPRSRSTSTPRIRPARFRLIRVRWTRGSRRSAPHRLWLRFGVADTSCYSGTRRKVDSRPLPVAPLHLGSPWRSAAERFGASSLGFDLARCRHDPPRTGHRAHRLGLARRTNRTRRPAPTWSTTPTRSSPAQGTSATRTRGSHATGSAEEGHRRCRPGDRRRGRRSRRDPLGRAAVAVWRGAAALRRTSRLASGDSL
jgi:hypothetical protein